MDKHKHKLSTHRGAPHARIWMEGARLVEAGFRHGLRFEVSWTPATLTLRLLTMDEQRDLGDRRAKGFGKVAGTPERPIIDIAGGPVYEAFGKHADYVSVTYEHGYITVRRAGS